MSCMTKELLDSSQQSVGLPILHFACCKSEKIALCGEELKGLAPEKDREVDCKECERINNMFPASACNRLSTCFIEN